MNLAIIIIIIAEILYSLTNYVDKFLVDGINESGSDIKTLILFSTLVAGLVFSPIWLIINRFNLGINPITLLYLFLSAVAYIIAVYLYFKSLETSDTSIVVAMFQLIPVFSYILGIIFFKETLTLKQLIGSIIIITSAILISIDKKEKNNNFKVLILMTLSSLLCSIYYLFFELGFRTDSYKTCAFYFQISLLVIGIILMFIKSFRTTFTKAIKSNGKKYLSVNIVNEFVNLAGMLLENYANVLIPIAIVTVVSRLQVVFVFIIGLLGTILLPKYFTENIDKKTIIKKLSCIALSIIGFVIAFV